MNNALLAIGALLIAALAALFAVPYAIDWNGYRGVFEEEASRMLGREVRVGGKVDVRFLPVPYVSFGKLRIADAVNETGEPLFRADSFTMWLSVPPLLRGVLEARAVELKKPTLRLVVDSAHGGSWAQTAVTGAGSLPFLPQAVALQSVRVSGGAVTIARADAAVLAEVTGVDGELEAEALEGPFRFKGSARWYDKPREVRLATARMDADGSMRFKATVRVTDTSNSYVLEGRLADLKQRPNLDGELTAKIVLPEMAGAAETGTPPAKGGPERPQIDVRAAVQADGTGFKMKDIALSLDNVGQPQLVSGEAQMAWVSKPVASVRLGARLLDLDRLAGAKDASGKPVAGKDGGGVLALARGLTASLVDALPGSADISTFLAIDQATLGGQDVSGVSLLVERAGGKLELKDLKAGVPGGGRLDAYGQFAAEAGHAFNGQVALRGANLQRFLDWAAKGAAAGRADGPFLVQGKLSLAEAAVELTEAMAEIGGATVSGDVRYATGERNKLAVTLDGRRVDAGQLWALSERGKTVTDPFRDILPRGILTGANTGQASAPAAAGAAPAQPPAQQAAAKPAFDFANLDVSLRVRAAELVAGDLMLADADADLKIEREKLVLTSLKGTTPEGLGLEIEGDVASFAREPRGTLRWVATAPTEAAAAALQTLAGLEAPEAGRRFAVALAPARIAGTTRLGADAGKITDISFDGQTRGGRVVGRLVLDGARAAWRKSPMDLTAVIDTADAAGLIRQLVPGSFAVDGPSEPRRAGRIDVKSAGVAETGLQTLVAVAADGLNAEFDGRVTAAAAAPMVAAGALRLDVRDARLAVASAGLKLGAGADSVPLKGEGDLSIAGETTTLALRRSSLGETHVEGTVSVVRAPGKATKVVADVAFDAGSLAALAAVLSERAPGNAAVAEVRSGWPDAPLDFAVLDNVDGSVKARFGRLAIQPGMALANAVLEARLEPRKIAVTKLDGEALQGRVASRLTLERRAADVAMTGDLTLAGTKLEGLSGVEDVKRARGGADVTLEVASQGLTPASLIASMKGKGEVKLADAEIAGFAPDALTAVADAVLAGKAEREGEGLSKALREAFAQGTLKIGTQKLPVEIVDGAARLAPLAISTNLGRTQLQATADLGQMKVDAEWRIEPRTEKPAGEAAAATPRGPLPAAAMIYVGAFGNLAAIEPRLSAGALERELSVRRMEREVEELERLRKADEERARAEQERQRQLEAERQKALQESQAAQQGQQAAPPPGMPPAPSPAWSGSTTVQPSDTVRPQAGPPPQGAATDGTASGAAAGTQPAANADAGKDSNAKTGGEKDRSAPPRPAPRPAAKPRPDQSQSNLYKQWN